jgi:methylthioribose-1-phosphate isomerase
MKVDGRHYRTIWVGNDGSTVMIIDQTRLPHVFATVELRTLDEVAHAIRAMLVRGAPLIGAAAAYGIAVHMQSDPTDTGLDDAHRTLLATRPTAVNLKWALDEMKAHLGPLARADRVEAAYARAAEICDSDVATNRAIGEHGLALIKAVAANKPAGEAVRVLTHCNAGWLATVDWGTATAPIFMAMDAGLSIEVWVDETRPRNQGASLTAFELLQQGVPHTVIADNVGGHLMQHGMVDMCIVGTDRTTAAGDVANKIGTYLKALAARDNGVPFYVALPSSTIDWTITNGLRDIPIEQRDGAEVHTISGMTSDGRIEAVRVVPAGSPVANYAFDVTPARLVTELITERGACRASTEGLRGLFPERAPAPLAAASAGLR